MAASGSTRLSWRFRVSNGGMNLPGTYEAAEKPFPKTWEMALDFPEPAGP